MQTCKYMSYSMFSHKPSYFHIYLSSKVCFAAITVVTYSKCFQAGPDNAAPSSASSSLHWPLILSISNHLRLLCLQETNLMGLAIYMRYTPLTFAYIWAYFPRLSPQWVLLGRVMTRLNEWQLTNLTSWAGREGALKTFGGLDSVDHACCQ